MTLVYFLPGPTPSTNSPPRSRNSSSWKEPISTSASTASSKPASGTSASFWESTIRPSTIPPDFILWLVEGDRQHIHFLDPHGLRHARAFQDAKIQFHRTIKEIESERLADPEVTLDSWILSPTARSAIEHWSDKKDPEEFLAHHVVFIYDDEEAYIDQILLGVGLACGATLVQ